MIPVWKTYVREPQRPFAKNALEDPDLVVPCLLAEIQFQFKTDELILDAETHCRYICLSCYAVGGDPDRVFQTGSSYLKYMKSGPTQKQISQMGEHAEQHSILWAWARTKDRDLFT